MSLFFKIKHHFSNAFREIFVHHHGSLNFRAKVFAVIISADENAKIENYIIIKKIALNLYHNDEERANLLILATKELVQKVQEDNGLYLETLIGHIQKELKVVPRYAKKIDTKRLQPLLSLPLDKDTVLYQEKILIFLEELKNETLKNNKFPLDVEKESTCQ